MTISITQSWVSLFNLPVLIQADTLILQNGVHLQILHECNGLTPFLLYAAAILAYPAYTRAKVKWLFFGYILLVGINTLRMLFITLVVMDYPEQFYLVHDWIGRYAVAILTVALFFWFTERVQVRGVNHNKNEIVT
ncbi:exosortase/archaeosortase family protein [Thiomicrorhabdus sp. zzn3]|uniref:exosortase/archaeosortase family protein n=1 Tax=Thiomicrorhabdus sp. zzn3 TaxID=3039775 RepID=UPI00243651CB|nr:exosortase/archaeosortase family protein [Thiomicrorhabdus sp. zzn3]MDG6777910.1 exosortase/archaeosortase family protein [Thiomicrorhabdus sp. zzn3]